MHLLPRYIYFHAFGLITCVWIKLTIVFYNICKRKGGGRCWCHTRPCSSELISCVYNISLLSFIHFHFFNCWNDRDVTTEPCFLWMGWSHYFGSFTMLFTCDNYENVPSFARIQDLMHHTLNKQKNICGFIPIFWDFCQGLFPRPLLVKQGKKETRVECQLIILQNKNQKKKNKIHCYHSVIPMYNILSFRCTISYLNVND